MRHRRRADGLPRPAGNTPGPGPDPPPRHRPGPPHRLAVLQPRRPGHPRHRGPARRLRPLPRTGPPALRHRQLRPARHRRLHHPPLLPDPAAEQALLDGLPAGFPTAADQQSAWTRAYTGLARHCADNDTTGLLAHLSTADTARDLDVLRQAVGDRRLTYWGTSYGTLLGAVYANLFPDRVRAMVLDSALDPRAWSTGRTPRQRALPRSCAPAATSPPPAPWTPSSNAAPRPAPRRARSRRATRTRPVPGSPPSWSGCAAGRSRPARRRGR
ncbi:alpha/beta hydrolase [Kitasatospora xanthocidica]|uniref:alpha/beta hydrolase n=1 Tax=Kitasatospora xanthocidica TaxID=83382 RepID=UPI00216B3C75|nr:alpha/beta hydrolase [Kitasatospora xanthocidica]